MKSNWESEENMRYLFDSTFEGIFIHDKGLIVDANKAAGEIFGTDISDLIGLNVTDVVSDEARKDVVEKLSQSIQNPEIVLGPYETIGKKKDGSTFDVELFSKGIKFRDKILRVVAFRDITDRKTAMRELIENERKYRKLFELTFEGIFLTEKGIIIDANPAALEALGLKHEDIVGMNGLDILAPESHKYIHEFRTLEEKDPLLEFGPMELKGLRADGTKVEIIIRSRPLMHKGKLIRFVAFRDISKRKKIESAMIEQNRLLQSILDNMGAGVVFSDENGNLLLFNPAAENILGLGFLKTEVDNLSRQYGLYYPDKTTLIPVENLPLLRAAKGEDVNNVEVYVKHDKMSEGKFIRINARPIRDNRGTIKGAVAVFDDITESKKANESICESEERFRSLIDASFEGIIIYDKGIIVEANITATKFFGYSTKEMIGMPLLDLIDDDYKKDIAGKISMITKNPEMNIGALETLTVRKDGTKLFVEVYGKGISFHGKKARLIAFRDITLRKQAEQTLVESETRLRKQNEVLVKIASSDIMNCGDTGNAAKIINEAAAKTLDAAYSSIWIDNDPAGTSRCLDIYNLKRDKHLAGKEASCGDIPGYSQALEEGRTLAVSDIHSDPRTKAFVEKRLRNSKITSSIDSPLRKEGRIVGSLNISHVGEKRTWLADEQSFVASLSDLFVSAQEACERIQAEEALAKILKFEDLLNEISDSFINSPMEEFERLFKEALKKICRFFKIDRSYISKFYDDSQTYDNIYERCEDGIEPQSKETRNIPSSIAPEWTRKLKRLEIINIPSVEGMHEEESVEKELMLSLNIKSIIIIPIVSHGFLYGFWGMDAVNNEMEWPKDCDRLLIALGRIFGGAMEHRQIHEELYRAKEDLAEKVEIRTRELKDKHTQLLQSEKMASLGSLVAGVAHEINTPLGALKSNNDIFIRSISKIKDILAESDVVHEIINNTRIPKMLETIDELNEINKTAAVRITKIVNSLRTFARLDQAEKDTVDIHEGLESTLTLVHHEIKNRITVKKNFGSLPKIDCFPNQINQVFMNILVNASQSIGDKGEISIKTYSKDKYAVVEISDTGKGIPKENIKKIFDPGFTTKGVGIGTGLGLSIVYQIIKEHKGDITLTSEVGKGTTFRIMLPV